MASVYTYNNGYESVPGGIIPRRDLSVSSRGDTNQKATCVPWPHLYQVMQIWRAPIVMISSLLLGTAMAVAHHELNVMLDKKPVDSIQFSQAWTSRFDTALAFLVKTAFAVTVGVAFVQRQWYNSHHQPIKVKHLDSFSSVLGNFFVLFGSTVWFTMPLLTALAIVSWVMPLAAVFTPGSLTVSTVRATNVTMEHVPQLSFNGSFYGVETYSNQYQILSTSDLLSVAYTTAAGGQRLPFPSAHPNQTYTLNFHGPALRCNIANDNVVRNLSALYGSTVTSTVSGPSTRVQYAAFIGNHRTIPQNDPMDPSSASIDGDAESPGAVLYIVTNFGSSSKLLNSSSDANTNLSARSNTTSHPAHALAHYAVNVTICNLWNASYSVRFTAEFPAQSSLITSFAYVNSVSAARFGIPTNNDTSAYMATMSAMGELLVGQQTRGPHGELQRLYTRYNLLDIDWMKGEAVAPGLEALSQNITLSLLSNAAFRKAPEETELVPVTLSFAQSIYVYTRFDLLVPYIIAAAAALLCTVVGMHAFLDRRRSFSNDYSSFVRATWAAHGVELGVWIEDHDDGADPVPQSLGERRLLFGGNGGGKRII